MDKKTPTNFSVSLYGALKPFELNPLLSLARVRIFYKGMNRNRTYITDEFAENLLKTLPYTSVGGIFNSEEDDFTDHGKKRDEGQIYGIVPENPNITWETHSDEDGVEREYACCDVVLFTSRYKEANYIIDKPHSMELYEQSIKGHWKRENGISYFEFKEGRFFGLQALGDNVEPCFEGAAFYTLASSLKEMVEEVKLYTAKYKGGEKDKMDKIEINFKISDSSKYSAIWNILNPNFNEVGEWTLDAAIVDIYDDYVLIQDYTDGNFYRRKYTKDEESNTVTLSDEKELTYIMDVSESELAALKVVRAMNQDSYEKIDEVFTTQTTELETLKGTLETEKATYEVEKETFEKTLTEKEEEISLLNTKIVEIGLEKDTLVTEKDTFEQELVVLKEYKAEIDKAEKQEILDQYAEVFSEDIMKPFMDNIDTYELADLEKDLAIKYVSTNKPAIFANHKEETFIPNGGFGKDDVLTGAAKLISKYKSKKNGGDN